MRPSQILSLLFLVGSSFAMGCELQSIGRIEPGASMLTVQKQMSSRGIKRAYPGFIQAQLSFPGITVGFDEDSRVAEIESTSPKYCLDGWICPGDSITEIRKHIPPGRLPLKRNSEIVIMGDGCWATIVLRKDRIHLVSIKCEP